MENAVKNFDLRFNLPEINTWRLFNKGITQLNIMQMVEAWESNGYRFGCVCIDDGWTEKGKLGDWVPDLARFPDMRGLVKWIHKKGYAVRLWVAPIQIHEQTEAFNKFNKKLLFKNGKPALFEGLGTYRLDPRIPEIKEHIKCLMQRLINHYLIDAFKVDFPPFYVAHDQFYIDNQFDFSESDNRTMVPDFYRLIRESIDEVNPSVRVECATDLPNCEPYIDDTICGDLVDEEQKIDKISKIASRLRTYSKGHNIVPWLEMVWGEGSYISNNASPWCSGFLEWMAISINFELKIEHSFQPFSYYNNRQIRILNNLYSARNSTYKVLSAGRKSWTVKELKEDNIHLDYTTNFLVAPEKDTNIILHTAELGTNSLQWHCYNILSQTPVILKTRNEFWGGTTEYCHATFTAIGGEVYKIWHEGVPDNTFSQIFNIKNQEIQ